MGLLPHSASTPLREQADTPLADQVKPLGWPETANECRGTLPRVLRVQSATPRTLRGRLSAPSNARNHNGGRHSRPPHYRALDVFAVNNNKGFHNKIWGPAIHNVSVMAPHFDLHPLRDPDCRTIHR